MLIVVWPPSATLSVMSNEEKKLSLNEAAGKLVAIAAKSLARFSDEERDARVEAFKRREFTSDRETPAKI